MQVKALVDAVDDGDDGEGIVGMLKAWGDWQRSRSGAPGSGSSLTGSYHEREDAGQGLVIARDPQSEELDQLICQMGRSQGMGMHYQRLMVSKYVWSHSNRQMAETFRCSEALVKIRIQTAHAWLHGAVFGFRLRVIL